MTSARHSETSAQTFEWRFLAPKYWGQWCVFGLLGVIAGLPYATKMRLATWLAGPVLRFAPARARIIAHNLTLAFPHLSTSEREALAKQHAQAMIMGLFELGQSAWQPRGHHQPLLKSFVGLEHFQALKAQNKPVILLGAHFSALEMAGALMSAHVELAVNYRRENNPLQEYFLQKSRSKHFVASFHKTQLRDQIRFLRGGGTLWYAPDQAFGGKDALEVTFFNHPARMAPSIGKLARLTGAVIVPYFFHRDAQGYHLRFLPSESLACADLEDEQCLGQNYHRLIEEYARAHPAQYFWSHRKFKGTTDYP